MKDERVAFPDRKDIEAWLALLSRTNPILRLKLPVVDDQWIDHILSIIERQKLRGKYTETSLCRYAAHIFYNIIKNHNYIDSNKRSAVVIVYLFFVLNSHLLQPQLYYREQLIKIEDLAIKVAESSRKSIEKVLSRIEIAFRFSMLVSNAQG